MEEQTKYKPPKWTIRLTFEEPLDAHHWNAVLLAEAVQALVANSAKFGTAKCTRLEVENDDY